MTRYGALLGIVALAALLRFPTLDVQSYWLDEAVTAVKVIQPSLSDTLHTIPTSEAAPPLYYGVAWLWSKVFGTGEVGLRSLSALAGTLTVVVAYAAAARLASPRAGLIAAALVATSPFLVWYSQEARSYALVVLLAAVAFLFFIRSLQEGRDRDYWLWALFSSLAVATHYFGAFPAVAEAAWLVLRGRRGIAVAASSLIALTCAVLLPLALDQADNRVGWIGDIPILERMRVATRLFVGGPGFRFDFHPSIGPGFVVAVGLLLIVSAAVYLTLRADATERRRATLAGGIGAVALGLPLAAGVVGPDYFIHRNVIVAWIPLAVAFAVLCAVRGAQPAGSVVAGIVAALFTGLSLGQPLDESRQRDDWRQAAEVLGPASPDRLIVTAPDFNSIPVRYYRPGARRVGTLPRPADGFILLTVTPRGLSQPPEAPPGFRITERRDIVRNEVLTMIWVQPSPARPIDAPAVVDAARKMGFDSVNLLAESPPF